jgi:hypothetical protein
MFSNTERIVSRNLPKLEITLYYGEMCLEINFHLKLFDSCCVACGELQCASSKKFVPAFKYTFYDDFHLWDRKYYGNIDNYYMTGGKGQLTDGVFAHTLLRNLGRYGVDWVGWEVNKSVGEYVEIYFTFTEDVYIRMISINILNNDTFPFPMSLIPKTLTVYLMLADN